jgi:hypothetical protein
VAPRVPGGLPAARAEFGLPAAPGRAEQRITTMERRLRGPKDGESPVKTGQSRLMISHKGTSI